MMYDCKTPALCQWAIRVCAVATLLAIVTIVAGCGKSRPPLAKAGGTVKINGKPVAAGRVLFLPKEGGKQGLARIQPDGSFSLKTYDIDDGAIVGSHHVIIIDVKSNENSEMKYSFAAMDEKPLTVEAGKDNHFDIELNSPNWRQQSNK